MHTDRGMGMYGHEKWYQEYDYKYIGVFMGMSLGMTMSFSIGSGNSRTY